MSVSKPTVTPTWASGGAVTTPSGGKQTSGWVPAERAAAQFFNWLFFNIGLWLTWLGALFTNGGTATGNMDLGLPVEGATPLAVFRDFKGNIRSTIDHLGFVGGSANRVFEQKWDSALGTTAPTGWTFTATVAGTATITTPDNTVNQLNERKIVLTTPAVNADSINASGQYKAFLTPTSQFCTGVVMEWCMGAVFSTSHGASQQGISFNASQSAFFLGGSASGFWQWSYTVGGVPTSGSTGIPYATAQAMYCRIEILANALTSQTNTTFQVNWYLNGARVHQENNVAFTSAACGESFINTANSANAPDILHVGGVRMAIAIRDYSYNI